MNAQEGGPLGPSRLKTVGRRGTGRFGGRLGILALLPVMSVLVVVFAVSASGGTATCSSTATLAGSGFEIDADANLVVNTAGCIDWLAGGTGTSLRAGVLVNNDKPSGATDDSFGQG